MTITELLAGDVLMTLTESAHGALWLGRCGSHGRILATDECGALIQPVFTVDGKDEADAPAFVPWTAIAAIKQRPAPPQGYNQDPARPVRANRANRAGQTILRHERVYVDSQTVWAMVSAPCRTSTHLNRTARPWRRGGNEAHCTRL
jgi:hypothetical protein